MWGPRPHTSFTFSLLNLGIFFICRTQSLRNFNIYFDPLLFKWPTSESGQLQATLPPEFLGHAGREFEGGETERSNEKATNEEAHASDPKGSAEFLIPCSEISLDVEGRCEVLRQLQ